MQLVDIRDRHTFDLGHIPAAKHLDANTVPDFIAGGNREQPVVVCCYHGISSQSAASFLAAQGFKTVYSLDGGFSAWVEAHPERVERT